MIEGGGRPRLGSLMGGRGGTWWVAVVVILCCTGLILAWFGAYSFQTRTSFDGSMNLQVAWSLAHGDGYRRTYADRPPFPQEVQTNAPFVIPAALVFFLFGMGAVQAQLVNFLYLCALAAAVFFLLKKRFDPLTASAGALLIVLTPGVLLDGMNGYGEVAGLFWAVTALLIYPWESRGRFRLWMAGLCLGLALSTKTVMAICVGAFGLVLVVYALTKHDRRLLDRLSDALLIGLGFFAPVLLFEGWKLFSLGGVSAYQEWWAEQFSAVGMQAGITPGYRDTAGYFSKFRVHLDLLAGYFGFALSSVLGWLILPILLAGMTVWRRRIKRQDGVLWALLLAAVIYFVWWLFVTPTQKAWHRRILNGSLMLNLSWVYLVALVAESWRRPESTGLLRYLSPVFGLLLAGYFLKVSAGPILLHGPPEDSDVDQAIGLLAELPEDARIYGIGWYSAPTYSLYSERPFLDLNDVVVPELDTSRPGYIVLDHSALVQGKQELTTSTYPSRPLLPDAVRVQIYEVDLSTVNAQVPEDRLDEVATVADLTSDGYPFVGGFNPVGRSTQRWMTSDGFVVLRYDGSPDLGIALIVPRPTLFVRPGGITLTVSVNDCLLGREHFEAGIKRQVRLPLPEPCRPGPGELATVRLSTDNLVDSPIIRDDRAMSVMMTQVGFVSGP